MILLTAIITFRSPLPVIIGKLNPVILGSANYHRHIVATDTFGRVDHELWRKLWN